MHSCASQYWVRSGDMYVCRECGRELISFDAVKTAKDVLWINTDEFCLVCMDHNRGVEKDAWRGRTKPSFEDQNLDEDEIEELLDQGVACVFCKDTKDNGKSPRQKVKEK